MPLLTATQQAQLLAQGAQRARDPDFDPLPVVKLYTPDARAVWLLAAAYPDDPRRVYGLCDAGTGFPQLMDVRLDDLQTLRGPNDYPLAVDPHFAAHGPLSAYAARAIAQGAYTED
ncbi:DUF2958 domain-containing protein [Achromobacter xylosoxidans]|jgi:hypothetical protein|uniref:DUF2958 domain-containing protein n=1 Tax=Alcaligenes xylosoxydans xylosoxydans TaxID=85698 RepID=UPI001F146171|nr:DUF2958 domain-containing protein [Achromobacter xylosoxidans]